ncbi:MULTISPECIES: OmpH family outer membrane protein [Acinetobacter]|nr:MULTISPECIES: OmpH family outer membrane protein [Acinetobacter]WPC36038.1 OmpH family outer membrane protein [Acinetobacter sp. YWS30-1]
MKKMMMAMGIALAGLTSLSHADDYGIVDLEKVVQNSIYLKQQNATLENEIKPQTAQIAQFQKDLAAIKQKGQTAKTPAEREKIAKEFEGKATQLAGVQQQVQATVQTRMQSVNKAFEGNLKRAAEQLRQENKLDVVLNKNSVLAYDAKYDLTDKMIQKVNAIK